MASGQPTYRGLGDFANAPLDTTPTLPTFTGPQNAGLPSGSPYSGTATEAPTATGDASSSDTGGGTNDNSDPTNLANDWYKEYFSQYGLPGDVQDQLISILTKYAADPSTGLALATQYLRGTPWYQQTFPGFNAGVQNGLFSDETGYRNYMNAINNVYNQYLGRHVSGDELSAILAEGANPNMIANRFQGQAWVGANQNEVQQLAGAYEFGQGQLSKDQLTALGNENAGIDTLQGQIQQKALAKAQQIRDKLFQGSLATPGLSLGANGLSAPGQLGTKQASDLQA